MTRKIPAAKQKTVKQFTDLVRNWAIVGVVDMENLPAKQLQNMREQLRDSVQILMSKKRLIKIAIENCKKDKPGIEKLEAYLRGMPAMIFTNENPFTLYKKLDKNKSSAPAKAGQQATKDIIVPSGPTPFSPGPIIGELGALKIKAGIEDGKVAVKQDTKVASEGDIINAQLASILTRLGIEPMEIGLNLIAVYEEGEVYTKDILAVDETEYLSKIASAAREAFSLAIGVGYATEDTISMLLQKAYLDAKALGLSQCVPADELVGELLARAESQGKNLNAKCS